MRKTLLWTVILVALLSICVLPLLCSCTDDATSNRHNVRIMSYNLLVNDINGKFGNRSKRVADTILKQMPDSFGVQEANEKWLKELSVRLGYRYAYVGIGRESDGSGENNAIFYRKDKYKLLETNTKWLSPTPDVSGSRFDGEEYLRIVTYAVLQSKKSDFVYVHVNTHLGLNENNRLWQIEVLLNEIKQYNEVYPTFVTGDFNDTPNSNVIRKLTENGFYDSRVQAKETDDHWTFPTPIYNTDIADYDKKIIDYCFHNGHGISVERYKVIADASKDGGYSSDHYPIAVDIKFDTNNDNLPS